MSGNLVRKHCQSRASLEHSLPLLVPRHQVVDTDCQLGGIWCFQSSDCVLDVGRGVAL